jgi:hypothetical protein
MAHGGTVAAERLSRDATSLRREKERDMKRRRLLFARVVLLLLVAIVGGVVGASSPALGVVSIPFSGTTVIPYSGTLDGLPEGVFLFGLVQVSMNVVNDPDFGQPPIVVLSFDLGNVFGVGLMSGAKYVTSGGQTLIRPLVASDVVEITFPIMPSRAGGALEARQAAASFTLHYDTTTGRFTGGTASTLVNLVGLPQ